MTYHRATHHLALFRRSRPVLRGLGALLLMTSSASLIGGCGNGKTGDGGSGSDGAPDGGSGGTANSSCPGETATCDGACVDIGSNADHCGACGNACAADEVCSKGVCGADCAAGETQCGQSCVDLTSVPEHCGACDNACTGGLECIDGDCSDGGSSTAPSRTCLAECQSIEDCPGLDPAKNWACEDNVCRPDQCASDLDCVVRLGTFVQEGCSSGKCNSGFICIALEDSTYCVPGGDPICEQEETKKPLPKEDGSGMVPVCVNEQASCEAGQCSRGVGCENDDDCSDALVCSDSGQCVCETEDHCPDAIGLDTCSNGQCTCSGDAACAVANGFRTYLCAELR